MAFALGPHAVITRIVLPVGNILLLPSDQQLKQLTDSPDNSQFTCRKGFCISFYIPYVKDIQYHTIIITI